MEKRTPEGKAKHDLGKKLYYEKKKQEKIEHEIQNGLEILGKRVRLSDFVKEKILSGKTQVLIIGGEVVQFRKKVGNGYWFNNNNKTGKVLYLHREKYKQEFGLTEDQMKGYEVHHIDGNKDNNNILNLKLLTTEEHHKIHDKRNEAAKRHVCKKCGRTYWSSVSKSVNICDRCEPKFAIGGSSAIMIIKTCKYCGAEYETKGVNRNKSKFCSNKCKSAYRRASGIDKIEKVCAFCGNTFKTDKYSGAIYCSPHCAVTGSKRSLL